MYAGDPSQQHKSPPPPSLRKMLASSPGVPHTDSDFTKRIPRRMRGCIFPYSTSYVTRLFPSQEVGPVPLHLCIRRLLCHLRFVRQNLPSLGHSVCFLFFFLEDVSSFSLEVVAPPAHLSPPVVTWFFPATLCSTNRTLRTPPPPPPPHT